MGLPKIDQPLFELIVPSTGKKVSYRPFTVKEEKILLIAQESKEIEQVVLAIKQIINNCVHDVDPDTMPVFDLEYIMLCIRAKSVNNEVNFTIKDPDTEEDVALSLNINEIHVTHNPDHSKEIELSKEYSIIMRYPTVDGLKALMPEEVDGKEESESQIVFRSMIACIDSLVNNNTDEVFKFSDFSDKEITEFVDQFTSDTVTGMQKFFKTVPHMSCAIAYKDNTGKDKTFNMEGMETFFT